LLSCAGIFLVLKIFHLGVEVQAKDFRLSKPLECKSDIMTVQSVVSIAHSHEQFCGSGGISAFFVSVSILHQGNGHGDFFPFVMWNVLSAPIRHVVFHVRSSPQNSVVIT
jgi:hypothetical protein